MTTAAGDITLAQLVRCFEGVVPAVVATASADGVPNITYLSKVQRIDDERVALSNQFFSKTAHNLAENPRASLLLIDPTTYDQYRLTIAYERTERRGPTFERLKDDVDALAVLEGMQDVFRLRAADIYRVLQIDLLPSAHNVGGVRTPPSAEPAPDPVVLAEMAGRLARSTDLDTLVMATVNGLADLLGYDTSMVLLVDEEGRRLFTIASRGYQAEGVGSEIAVGEGLIGMAAARCTSLRIGNLRHMSTYSRTVRRSYEDRGDLEPLREVPVPNLPNVQSRLAVPCLALGQLVGILVVESVVPARFTAADEAMLTVVASLFASAVEAERAQEGPTHIAPLTVAAPPIAPDRSTRVRFFEADGSTFLDGDYLIKGVAGRILWALLGHHEREGRVEFTNREVRLDASLGLPAFRDNFESRLILLKRRLDERAAPLRIEKTGRGCFRLVVETTLTLERG